MIWLIDLQANPESTVGALTMAGKGVRVLITPTSDFGEMLSCINGKLPCMAMLFFVVIYYSVDTIKITSIGFAACYLDIRFNGT